MTLPERLAELEEEVRQLRALLAPKVSTPGKWLLAPMEKVVFAAIAAGRGDFISSERIIAVMDGRRRAPIGAPDITMRQYVLRLRRKLAPFGIVIESRQYYGYRLSAASSRALK